MSKIACEVIWTDRYPTLSIITEVDPTVGFDVTSAPFVLDFTPTHQLPVSLVRRYKTAKALLAQVEREVKAYTEPATEGEK